MRGYENVGAERDEEARRPVARPCCVAAVGAALALGLVIALAPRASPQPESSAPVVAGDARVEQAGAAAEPAESASAAPAESNYDLDESGCIRSAPQTYDGGGQVGFVFGATDIYANKFAFKCIAAVESLVRVGGWMGPIYIFSGSISGLPSPCFDQRRLRETTGNPNIHVLDHLYRRIKALPGAFNFGGQLLRTSAKAIKGLMLDLVGESGPPILIFHDCDKVVAQPGCVADMVRQPPVFSAQRQLLLSRMEARCLPNEAGRCGDGIHTGVVALHREYSLPFARAWARHHLLKPKLYDRYTLWHAWNASRQRDGSHLWTAANLSEPYRDVMWKPGKPSCFNHISGGRCHEFGPHASRRFIQKLCLKSEYPPRCNSELYRPPPGELGLNWCGGGRGKRAQDPATSRPTRPAARTPRSRRQLARASGSRGARATPRSAMPAPSDDDAQ